MKSGLIVYFVLLLSPIFWAGNFIVGRAVADTIDPLGLDFSRWTLTLYPYFLLLLNHFGDIEA